jgi:tuftelin-interacting protein 11
MGWDKGGIGKTKKGLAEPIQTKIRPKFAGLGTIDEKTEQQKRKSQEIEEKSEESENDEEKAEEILEHEVPRQQLWKKGAPKKRRVYKTVADIVKETPQNIKQKELVVDMRGPQVKIFSGLDKIHEQNKLIEKKKFIPELQHNISLLVDLKEGQIHSLEQKRRHEEMTIAALKREEEELTAQLDTEDKQIERVQSILEIIEKCQERMNSTEEPLDLDFLFKVFDLFQNKFSKEYKLYQLESLIFAFVFPLIKEKLTKEWSPLTNPTFGSELLAKWRPLLDESERNSREEKDKNNDSFEDLDFESFQSPTETYDTYNRLIGEIVLPRLRHVIAYEWNVRDPSSLLSLLDSLRKVLPSFAIEIILEQYILARLRSEVEQWNPTQDPIPIHTWIHPWNSLLGPKLQPLYSSIRQKLGVTLQAWHPSDESAYLILRPWKDVWDQQSMDQLLIRCVLPKLLLVMHEFVVNPASQVMEPFKWVMRWEDIVSPHLLIQIFEQEFFPKFHNVLRLWLTGSPNYDEVTRWYLNWKKQFPERLLQNERVTAQFNYALELMNVSLSGGNVSSMPPLQSLPMLRYPPATTTTEVAATSKLSTVDAHSSSPSHPLHSSPHSPTATVTTKKTQTLPMASLSFKEVIERIVYTSAICISFNFWHRHLCLKCHGYFSSVGARERCCVSSNKTTTRGQTNLPFWLHSGVYRQRSDLYSIWRQSMEAYFYRISS